MVIDNAARNVLSKFLFDYELVVRGFREKHGFSSPNVEDDDGL